MVYKNCKLYDDSVVDIQTENGTITQIAPSIDATTFQDLQQAYILPKLYDLNTHLLDATLNAKNIHKLSKEAQQGGIGHLVIMPESTPSIDDEVVFEFVQNNTNNISSIKMDITINTLKKDSSLSNIAILLKKGAVAPYMSTIAKNNVAIKIAEYVKMYNTTLFCKAEDNSLKSQGVMLEGDISSQLGLSGIPEIAEVVHVSRMIEIARYYDIAILFKAIANPRSLEMIEKAKAEGINVYAEVSLHHLIKSDNECKGFNTTAKIDPPLIDAHSQKKLIKALKEDKIEILTLLHQPNSPVNKAVAFYDASYGSSSLKEGLALYYTYLVKSGLISMKKLIELTVINPAKLIGYDVTSLSVGDKVDDFLIFDTHASFLVKDDNSLYNNETLFGTIKQFI